MEAVSHYVDDAPRIEIPGRGWSTLLVHAGMGAGKFAMHLNVLRPGTKGQYHYHQEAENAYLVLAGTGKVVVEGEEVIVGPDQVLFIPPGIKHSVENIGTDLLRLIEIYAPPAYPNDFHVVDGAEA